MIKYHGTPITSKNKDVLHKALTGRSALVSYANQQDLQDCLEICDKIMLDNGAFSTWSDLKKGKIKSINWKEHWGNYYKWVLKHFKNIDYFIIPDVIDGTEKENDELITDFLRKVRYGYGFDFMYKKAIPVWHLNESLEKLRGLMEFFGYIAFGSSGEFSQLGTEAWHKRMNEAMRVVCNKEGFPTVKIHMLRCLDAKLFTQYPFYSGDSTNLARNHKRDGWQNILNRTEKYDSPKQYKFKTYYETKNLFEVA